MKRSEVRSGCDLSMALTCRWVSKSSSLREEEGPSLGKPHCSGVLGGIPRAPQGGIRDLGESSTDAPQFTIALHSDGPMGK